MIRNYPRLHRKAKVTLDRVRLREKRVKNHKRNSEKEIQEKERSRTYLDNSLKCNFQFQGTHRVEPKASDLLYHKAVSPDLTWRLVPIMTMILNWV